LLYILRGVVRVFALNSIPICPSKVVEVRQMEIAGSFHVCCPDLANVKDCHKNDIPSTAIHLGMLVLLVVLRLQQTQAKNCPASARSFIGGAPEFVLREHPAESGEKKVCASTTLLLCALFRTAACGLGSFSVKEHR